MAKAFKAPKFNVGDKVKEKNASPKDFGEVMSFAFDGEHYSYRITSKELDFENKEVINGVKTLLESEVEAVK